jgi:hypothetical protein
MKKAIGYLFVALLLSACGGGGGDGGSPSAPDYSPYMVKSVVTYTTNAFTVISNISPTAQGIPANSVSGLFSTPNSFTNGSVSFSPAAPAPSNLPLVGYEQIVPVLTSPEFTRFTTGGSTVWPRARFGMYSTARKTAPASTVVDYIDMPYIAVNSTPTSVASGTYSNASGRAVGLLASAASFPWLRCVASATLSVAGSTRAVALTLSGCKDSYDVSGAPSGNNITVSNPTITLTTTDNVSFAISGNPTFTFGAGPTTFTPTSFRGDFRLAGTVNATEIVGRLYMTNGSGVHGTLAFGVIQ